MAVSAMGLGYPPKYPPNFSHFDYVNPAAPKGGELVLSEFGNYDGLNPFLLKGVSASRVTELVFETLMEQSLDEPFSLYAHLAEDIQLAADKLSVTFRLNAKARFSDGTPVTADDVKFSFDTLKSEHAHPMYRFMWNDIKRAVVVDKRTVRFEFARVNPELHLITAQIPIFSRKWVGNKPFDKVITELPIGSGPYVVGKYDLGKNISYKRNPAYWAKDLNTRRGMFNFERVVIKYYGDDTVQLEAFKAGEFDFMFVLNSKQWARDYVGPKFDSGAIKREELAQRNNAGMQGFVFNIRRPLFKDKRVRQAISLAFDFEWSNKNLFYNQYARIHSYFSNSELASSGLPKGAELALLEPYRAQLPPELFTSEWKPPVANGPDGLRDNLRKAKELLTSAGWKIKEGVLQNEQGQKLEFEILLAQKAFGRIVEPFAQNLAKVGIKAGYRLVDVALYQRRLDTRDFDMTVSSFPQSQSPGNEQINYFHSSAADQEGSNNVIGIKDAVVDALVDKLVYAPDRAQLVTATHALDRVLLHGEYMVPNWYTPIHRVVYKSSLAYPNKLPLYYSAEPWMLRTWWKKQ
ncbi:MAG: extracellular solute-binding protein [Gallionellaceae bacterium]|nr:extracellular solute-binding protein [Gallionellaceae bacterium]